MPVTRYEACHSLLVDTTVPDNVEQWDVRNLGQLAQRIPRGEIPESVAAEVGVPVAELTPRVRVLVRNDIQSLTVCSVGETPGEVEEIADAFATALLTFLDAEAVDFQAERLENARGRAAEAESCVSQLEAEIAERLLADPEADTLALDQQLSACRLELAQSNSEIIAFESSGVPVVPLETLEQATAATISERAYESRLRAGARARA